MKYALLRSGGLFLAFLIGGLLPCLAEYCWLIRVCLVFMLFSSYLKVELSWKMFHLSQITSILLGIGLALLSWWLLRPLDEQLAQVAFFTAITPTATAAPVIVGLIGGNITYAVTTFILSGISISLLLPFLIPLVMHSGTIPFQLIYDVFLRIGLVMFMPLIVALLLRAMMPSQAKVLAKRLGPTSFYAWIIVVILITANARAFLDQLPDIPWITLIATLLIAGVLCLTNFVAGYLLGGKFRLECSQCLGQKNNSYTVYLALTYANPLVALGPTFYVFYHNTWNAIQLFRHHAGDKQ